jgi:hypothetical protein
MMGPPAVAFPNDYASSRARFRDAATRFGWVVQTQAIDGTGPNGEELAIDAAISPGNGGERALVVSSGLHGVEGPFGAAVQIAAMNGWADGVRAGVRGVFLHALNPYAFAWGRRVDAANVDPNRNFLLTGQHYSGSPVVYKEFDALLNPRRPPARFDGFIVRSWLAILRHGMPALKQALVSGQYDYPRGIFFGGHGPTATHLALRERLREWVGPAAVAVHLDFHTGLGRWGSDKLLLDAPVSGAQRRRLDKWFGRDAYEEDDPRGVAYLPRGSFGPWCIAQGFADDYTYLVAEFGTFGIVRMLTGIRAENQAHHWGRAGDAHFERAKSRLRELFCPLSPEWRTKVLARGVDLVGRAAAGLAAM